MFKEILFEKSFWMVGCTQKIWSLGVVGKKEFVHLLGTLKSSWNGIGDSRSIGFVGRRWNCVIVRFFLFFFIWGLLGVFFCPLRD